MSAGYGDREVIKGIDLDLYPGEFVSLVGENGAGKSTLALVAAGLLGPHSGRVRYRGGVRPKPGLDIAIQFQNPQDQLFTDGVEEEVAFAPQNYGQFKRDVYQRVLQETGLQPYVSRRLGSLPAGQQLRKALAASLTIQPRLIILDEPTLGQDWGHLEQLMNYVRELNRRGTAILLISHDYKLVHRYTQRILLMEEGEISMQGYVRDQ